MEKYKVKLSILNDDDEEQVSVIIISELIEDMKNYHDISILDTQLEILLKGLNVNRYY